MTSFSFTALAGKITSIPSASGADGFGGWNLENVDVILDGTLGSIGDPHTSWFNELDGAYNLPITTVPLTKKKLSKQTDVAGIDKGSSNPIHELGPVA